MALSQKHSGKILTPWFDTAEWKITKGLICDGSLKSQLTAIDRLNIWKLRTPILSVGIEGTLILLEAIVEKRKNLNDFELSHIYSTALLRFLNICAANNDKQGTFYKTAEQNELPYWLITLRHDIAHDHKIPSKRMLEVALNESLKWINEKYWNVQEQYLKDYVISDKSQFREIFSNYAKLVLFKFYDGDLEEIKKNLKKIVRNFDENDSIKFLENYIGEVILNGSVKDGSNDIVSVLVDEKYLLSSTYQIFHNVKKLPEKFCEIWMKIIYLLIETETISLLINKLFDVTNNSSSDFDEDHKEVASIWISKLYKLDEMPREHSEKFQQKFLQNPNKFTLNYLEIVMKFNSFPQSDIKQQYERIKILVGLNQLCENENVHSVRDFKEVDRNHKIIDEIDRDIDYSTKKFKKLSSSEKIKFKGYPFGALPNTE